MEQDASVGHEASVSRIGEEQLFYLMSRGPTETEASTMIVNGFIEPLVKRVTDGICRRAESLDTASNGGVGRLIR